MQRHTTFRKASATAIASAYASAVDRLGVPANAIAFQSSNAWDAYAASAFGMRVAWCNRYGQRPERLPGRPDREFDGVDEMLCAAALDRTRPIVRVQVDVAILVVHATVAIGHLDLGQFERVAQREQLVDHAAWRQEAAEIGRYFETFGSRLPERLRHQLALLHARLA